MKYMGMEHLHIKKTLRITSMVGVVFSVFFILIIHHKLYSGNHGWHEVE